MFLFSQLSLQVIKLDQYVILYEEAVWNHQRFPRIYEINVNFLFDQILDSINKKRKRKFKKNKNKKKQRMVHAILINSYNSFSWVQLDKATMSYTVI